MDEYTPNYFEDVAYTGVEFPDLPGCFSQAAISVKKALECYFGEGDDSHRMFKRKVT